MAVYSVFTFNGENDIMRLHLGILNDYVDKFIVVEANKTFTGHPKPLYFLRDQRFFKDWWKKIQYYVVSDWDDVGLWEMAINSPNTKGAEHWKREFYIKESIQKALKSFNVEDEDTLFIGDVDEIINPKVEFEADTPLKARLKVYAYYLNNSSSEEFWGTLICQYKDIKDKCLNHLRSDPSLYSNGGYLGWHFTSMGGLEEVKRKLNDSYTKDSYNTEQVQSSLSERVEQGQDYLGRSFEFRLDEDEWPDYLKANRKKFEHLCK